MRTFNLIATSTFGLEALVKHEINQLGYEILAVENGKVTFKGDEKAICRANLWLRTADRIRLKMGEFKATSFEELFQNTKALPWSEVLPRNACFPVEGKSIKSQLFSVPDCQAITKKAVVESMKQTYRQNWFPEEGPLYKLEVALWKDLATLTVDATGAGLHKRGYRKKGSHAPLKETLAAGLLHLARWNADIPLIDPFCGSGTIPIEAALKGKNIAPGLYRSFVAEDWPILSQNTWREAREEARSLAQLDRPLQISGIDADEEMIELSEENARNILGANSPSFINIALNQVDSKEKYGKIIGNPPYGERLGEAPEVDRLYKEMGRVFRDRFPTWSYYILTPHTGFEDLFGQKATKKRKLYNGRIKVDFYQYYGPKPPGEERCSL